MIDSGIIDSEKVIKGLECCRRGFCFACPYNDGIDENTDCKQQWADDALALLKAQEPRVITLEEIPYAVFGWMEVFDQIIPCILGDVDIDDTVEFSNIEDGHNYMCASDYGKTWRVWTAEPTEEQRRAAKWDDT